MKIPKGIAKELMYCSKGESIDEYEVVDVTEWTSDGKYEHKSIFGKFEGKYFELFDGRTGSYYSDYYHDSEDWEDEVEVRLVEPVEVKTIKWVTVKES